MARRIEIELTSQRADGTWTWRVAGAREPRGVVEGSILSANAHVGDVLRAEAEFELEGITILSVLQGRERREQAGRIELVATKPVTGGVTTTLVDKKERRGRERRPGAPRERRPEGRSPSGGAREGRPATASRSETRDGARGPARPPREERESRPPRDTSTPPRDQRRRAPTRPPRPVASTTHRDLLFATLLPEQRPIAEQLALGGLAAVRRALADQQTAARAANQPFTNSDAILALAEQLLPSVREATWLDRATNASANLETISLRDLRAVVTSAAAKDDVGRSLLASLREALDARVVKLRTGWEDAMTRALDENKTLQALRLSGRPPEPSARFPAGLVVRLTEAASAALSSTTPEDRWLQLLEAAVESPIRRSIKPAGLPENATLELRKAAALQAGRIPALAALLGLAMPPPPRGGVARPAPRRNPSGPGPRRRSTNERSPVTRAAVDATAGSDSSEQSPPATSDATAANLATQELRNDPQQTEVVDPKAEAPDEV